MMKKPPRPALRVLATPLLLVDCDWETFRNAWADKVFKTCFIARIERNVTYLFCQTEAGAQLQVTENQLQHLTAAKKDGPDACPLLWGPPAHPKSLVGRRFWISDQSQFYQSKGNKNQWLKRDKAVMFSSPKQASYHQPMEQILQGCSGLPKLDISVNILQLNKKVSVWFRNCSLAFVILWPFLYLKSD